jgi:hypothetical protein
MFWGFRKWALYCPNWLKVQRRPTYIPAGKSCPGAAEMEVKLNNEEVKRCVEATCPDCRGPLSETTFEDLREYKCLVGHRYSARGLLQAHSETQEKSLWSAVVALEEAANLVEAVAKNFPDEVAERLREQAAKKILPATEIRRVLEQLEVFETELNEP